MKTGNTGRISMIVQGVPAAMIVAIALLLAPAPPASAGVSFGVAGGGGGFSFSLGYSDYPVYSPAWYQPGFSMSFTATLDGYGQWVTVDGLGRVWRPWVAPGWRPYTWGRWVYTSYGWTWVAYEPWGYVPHHYGSWAMTSFGWVWSPAYVYRPANVAWVSYGSYVGWYPAPPPGWSQAGRAWARGYGAGHFDGYRQGYGYGYADGWRDARYANFVPWNRMTSDNIAVVATPGARLSGLRPGNVRVLASGPSRLEVQRAVGRAIPTLRVSERTVTMGGRSVRAVRPAGVERAIESHSRETVRRSLAPSIARTMDRGGRVTRRAPDRSSGPSQTLRSPSVRGTRSTPRGSTGLESSGSLTTTRRTRSSRFPRPPTGSARNLAERPAFGYGTTRTATTARTHRSPSSHQSSSRYMARDELSPARSGTRGTEARSARLFQSGVSSRQPSHERGRSTLHTRSAWPQRNARQTARPSSMVRASARSRRAQPARATVSRSRSRPQSRASGRSSASHSRRTPSQSHRQTDRRRR